jgi:hypothetical protein
MPDKFDPYREALVVETNTIWPAEHEPIKADEKERMERALHADPRTCAHLEYLRVHTGFCRQITVTAADIERLRR